MSSQRHATLSSEAQIRAYLHQTRMSMLALLRDGPSTISRIASSLGVHPANLTRHLRTLVEAGLVELDHTRDTGRNLEKYYRSIADTFDVAPGADELTAPHKVALEFARSDLSAAIAQLPETIEQPALAFVVAARLRDADLQAYCLRLEALSKEFEALDTDRGVGYHLNLSVYPGPWRADDPTVTIERSVDPA